MPKPRERGNQLLTLCLLGKLPPIGLFKDRRQLPTLNIWLVDSSRSLLCSHSSHRRAAVVQPQQPRPTPCHCRMLQQPQRQSKPLRLLPLRQRPHLLLRQRQQRRPPARLPRTQSARGLLPRKTMSNGCSHTLSPVANSSRCRGDNPTRISSVRRLR